MKTVFVSASYVHREDLRAALDAIAESVAAQGWRAHIFVQEYAFAPDQQRDMMAATLRDLRAADILIAEVSHKAIGVGIEVGYAAALGIPIIYVRHASAESSTTVGGLAIATITYQTPRDLRETLDAELSALS